MLKWQSIETAPKDGTEIIARGYNWGNRTQGRHRHVVKWSGDRWIDAEDEDLTLRYLEEWHAIEAAS